jgi:Zn-dependent protease
MDPTAVSDWTLVCYRKPGFEVRLAVHFPLLALVSLWVCSEFGVPARIALLAPTVLLLSVACHELARCLVARRMGGKTRQVVLGPLGGWVSPELPDDPPAHLLTALAGPTAYLTLVVLAACGLTTVGATNLVGLLAPFSPALTFDASLVRVVAELIVWINSVLLLVSLLPIRPFDGAELVRGILWPVVDRETADSAVGHVALLTAVASGILAIMLRDQIWGSWLPAWFALSALCVLMIYGSSQRRSVSRRYDLGIEIDEFDSDDEQWLSVDLIEDDRAAVLVEQVQQRQQEEALERKRRDYEDQEDARVDDILMRLQNVRFEDLSEEEQAILKRASRRYRRRLGNSS